MRSAFFVGSVFNSRVWPAIEATVCVLSLGLKRHSFNCASYSLSHH